MDKKDERKIIERKNYYPKWGKGAKKLEKQLYLNDNYRVAIGENRDIIVGKNGIEVINDMPLHEVPKVFQECKEGIEHFIYGWQEILEKLEKLTGHMEDEEHRDLQALMTKKNDLINAAKKIHTWMGDEVKQEGRINMLSHLSNPPFDEIKKLAMYFKSDKTREPIEITIEVKI